MNTIPKAARDTSAVLLIAAALVLGFGPRATASTPAVPPPAAQPILTMRSDVATPITVAAVGDSITAWHSAWNNPTYNLSLPFTRPWSTDLSVEGPVALNPNDGWAMSGRTLEDMAANVQPIQSDVLFVMGGVNDLGARGFVTPRPVMYASLEKIFAEAQAKRCVIGAIAPSNINPAGALSWNVFLQKIATQQGCGFVDPWVAIRNLNGTYISGFTMDGVHPNDAGMMTGADRISEYIAVYQSGR